MKRFSTSFKPIKRFRLAPKNHTYKKTFYPMDLKMMAGQIGFTNFASNRVFQRNRIFTETLDLSLRVLEK